MSSLIYGDLAGRSTSQRIAAPVASVAALKAIGAAFRVDKQIVQIQGDLTTGGQTLWQWEDGATVSGDDILAIRPNDNPTTGRWMRLPGRALLAIQLLATTPTGTNLLTVPSGTILALHEFGYRVTRIFTGPSNAGIAISSTNHPLHTGVGGFAGSMVATQLNNLFSATAAGSGCDVRMFPTASGTFDSIANKRDWLKGGDTIRLDVIGAGFGTGVGQVLIACDILQNPGTMT